MMAEKGFLDAEVTHDMQPTFGREDYMTLTIRISDGKRTKGMNPETVLSPQERCPDVTVQWARC